MQVIGYDPFLSVNAALRLSSEVKVVTDLDDLAKSCDYITIHIPYIASQNKGIINSGLIRKMKDGVVIETGTHEELLNRQGFYYSLYNSQFSH